MQKVHSANKVFLERPNLIRVIVAGAQTGESVAVALHQVRALIDRPETEPGAELLIDLTANPAQNLAARIEARNFLAFLHDHRIAIFGAGYILKTVVDIIIKGSGRAGQVGNFY